MKTFKTAEDGGWNNFLECHFLRQCSAVYFQATAMW